MNADVLDAAALPATGPEQLPARRLDSKGRAHVNQRAVLALALPLMATSAIQVVLNLTDMWFVGHISTQALAAVGAVHFLIVVIMCVLGGVVVPVQTIVAQAQGAGRYKRASHATWTALWATLCVAPLFVAIALSSHFILVPFGFDRSIETLASEFWFPRVLGCLSGVAVWALLGFFNGIGRPKFTLLVSIVTTGVNIPINALFIFGLRWGIAGSGWATAVAQACGLVLALSIFLSVRYRRKYGSHLTWKPRAAKLLQLLRLGLPMGLVPAADLLGFSLFQMMQVRFGTAGGAATQLVMMLTSISYMPGYGIASAATTLVGEAIGAGDRNWAMRVGTRVIGLAMLYMGVIGVLLALAGPWIVPLFIGANDVDSVATAALCAQLLWLAAGYQLFDGLYAGAASCLRGAGDATVPAALVLSVSGLIFVPLAHSFTFPQGQGWVNFLPQFGWGAVGGWLAVLIYVMVLGITLFLRWRSRAWQTIRI